MGNTRMEKSLLQGSTVVLRLGIRSDPTRQTYNQKNFNWNHPIHITGVSIRVRSEGYLVVISSKTLAHTETTLVGEYARE